jgi:hypothetical protein
MPKIKSYLVFRLMPKRLTGDYGNFPSLLPWERRKKKTQELVKTSTFKDSPDVASLVAFRFSLDLFSRLMANF